MARFTARRLNFGPRPADDTDDGTGLPTPLRVKLAARRAAGIAEAAAVLEHLPAPGESLHALCTARMDLTDILNHLFDKLGPCDKLTLSTLGYNRRNFETILRWLDSGAVRSLTLLASIFFRSHNAELWEQTQTALRKRGQRAACCHCHAKVVAMTFASGEQLAIEGSANLCGNGSGREQFCLVNDPMLSLWHERWVCEAVAKHEGAEEQERNLP